MKAATLRKRKSRAKQREQKQRDYARVTANDVLDLDPTPRKTEAETKTKTADKIAKLVADAAEKADLVDKIVATAKGEAPEVLTIVKPDRDGRPVTETIPIPKLRNPKLQHLAEFGAERQRAIAQQRFAEQDRANPCNPQHLGGSTAHGFADPWGIVSQNIRAEKRTGNIFGWPDDSI